MTTISSGETHTVSSGFTENGDIVLAGGELDVLSGGTIINTVDSGGFDFVSGNAIGTTVSSGVELVQPGGMASGTILSSGGFQQVNVGTAIGTIVSSGGTEQIFSGGTASATIVSSGGLEDVFGGGTTSATIIDGGLLRLEGGAVASGGIVFAGSGGTLEIDDRHQRYADRHHQWLGPRRQNRSCVREL